MSEVICVQQARALLGEGPAWLAAQQVLYWVDIERPAVFRYDPLHGQTDHWLMSGTVGCVVPTKTGNLLFTSENGVGVLDTATGATDYIAVLEEHMPGNRFNDGKVDRRGRFWFGSMDREARRPTGSLYRLDPDYTVRQMASGFVCSNGIGWSPDDRIMYVTDSVERTIWSYDFNAQNGTIGERRVFTTFSATEGMPDGLTVDSKGFVWSAIWDGWRLMRFSPDGQIERTIDMPVQRPTSCAFGGADLRTLYITSASIHLSPSELQAGPLAGALFSLRVKMPGLEEVPFGR